MRGLCALYRPQLRSGPVVCRVLLLRDLADKWLNGEYFPLLYSRNMVLKSTRQRNELQPVK
jgi:hypothetical protein